MPFQRAVADGVSAIRSFSGSGIGRDWQPGPASRHFDLGEQIPAEDQHRAACARREEGHKGEQKCGDAYGRTVQAPQFVPAQPGKAEKDKADGPDR